MGEKMGYKSQKQHKKRKQPSKKAGKSQGEKETASTASHSKKTHEAGQNWNSGRCVSPFMAHIRGTEENEDFLVSQKSMHMYPLGECTDFETEFVT